MWGYCIKRLGPAQECRMRGPRRTVPIGGDVMTGADYALICMIRTLDGDCEAAGRVDSGERSGKPGSGAVLPRWRSLDPYLSCALSVVLFGAGAWFAGGGFWDFDH